MPSPDSDMTASSPRKLGCINCRDQHLKCDRVAPVCGRCKLKNRECCWIGIVMRTDKYTFGEEQKWVRIENLDRLVFINENKKVRHDGSSEESGEELEIDSGPQGVPWKPDIVMQIDHVISPSSSIVSPASPTDRFFRRVPKSDSDEDEVPPVEPVQDNAAATPDDENQQTVDNSVLPFSDELEARLFMHFVQKLATWLDLCDPAQSFERIVPARAQSGNCPILLNAILALSARHMSHISNCDYPQSLALQYSQKCFDDLNHILDQPGAILDENLFAAAIILRVLEEMDVKDTGRDLRTHLIGIKRFVEARVESLVPGFVPGSLSAASFWVGLRQEIYSAVMTSQAVHISLLHSLVDRSLKQADDYTWANRAVVHCADVLNFCFGEKSEVGAKRRTEEWVELNRRSKQWIDGLPPSFRPIFDGKGNGAFPHICYWRSCHVIGMQHHLLAELFLVHYDPRPLVNEPDRQLANHIQELVRRVCGIGLSNEWTPPSMFTACMVIAAFGDLFHDRQDQEAMIEILKKTEKDHLRPTEEVQKKMRVTWGWPQHNR